ncbi:MAG: helix-turn-helix domain-containing protein [Alicyclobacillus sp.]|nr:helix-turn-helix domain-containing protein [Alicyclobacillus sp.]
MPPAERHRTPQEPAGRSVLPVRLREERARLGWTQQQMAEKLQISRSTLSKYETGENEPSADLLCQLAETFGVTTDYLLGRSDERYYALAHQFHQPTFQRVVADVVAQAVARATGSTRPAHLAAQEGNPLEHSWSAGSTLGTWQVWPNGKVVVSVSDGNRPVWTLIVETHGAAYPKWKVKAKAVDGTAMVEYLYLTELILSGLNHLHKKSVRSGRRPE